MELRKTQVFLDGACDIYGPDETGRMTVLLGSVPYNLRTVGSKRFYEAAQIGHTLSRVVRIPDIGREVNDCHAVIRGKTYQIVQCQEITDTSPRCLQLSLEQPNICWAAQREES